MTIDPYRCDTFLVACAAVVGRLARRTYLPIAIALVSLLTPSPTWAQARFTGLGFFGGYESRATDVSADGRVVVGFSEPNIFRWTRDISIVRPSRQGRPALSADGSVVVGNYSTPENTLEPFRWVIGESFTPLGDFAGGYPFPIGRAFDVSADGRTVVGHGDTAIGELAFRWTPETGMVGLGGIDSRAHGVSADGTVAVGYTTGANSLPHAVRWSAQTGMLALPRPNGTESSEAHAVSADGVVVVGVNVFASRFDRRARAQAFRWTANEGLVLLDDLPGSRVYSIAYDVSADGSVIVGSGDTLRADGSDTLGAFYWTQERGMVDLYDLLVSQGVTNLEGWRLSEVRGVSADGLTVVGTGVHDGRIEAFVATVPEPSGVILALLAAASLSLVFGVRRLVAAFVLLARRFV
ncbi:MAG: hypothetical protein WD894_23495 [Pirellulales bacterium]